VRLPDGTRVHHHACEWSYGFTEADCAERPNWGWGTVLRSVPQHDGAYEYEVEKDAPMFEGYATRSWWARYHIDDWRGPVPRGESEAA
jgi:hypothetical protein